MKKIKYVLLIVMVVLLTGCNSSKDNPDASSIKSILEENNYTVTDATSSYDYSEVAYYTSKLSTKITFVKGNKKYDIQGIFLDECENVYLVAEDDYEKKINGGKNWTTLKVTDSTNYYFVGWIGDSYIKIESTISNEDKLDKLVSDLGF